MSGAGRAGLYGRGEDEEGGALGGLWAEEGRDLTRVLTGASWLLRGGPTAGTRVGAEDRADGIVLTGPGTRCYQVNFFTFGGLRWPHF